MRREGFDNIWEVGRDALAFDRFRGQIERIECMTDSLNVESRGAANKSR
jgi:hypothetical protein